MLTMILGRFKIGCLITSPQTKTSQNVFTTHVHQHQPAHAWEVAKGSASTQLNCRPQL